MNNKTALNSISKKHIQVRWCLKQKAALTILIVSIASIACDKDPDYINAEGQRCFINPYSKKHNCYGQTFTSMKKAQEKKCDVLDVDCFMNQIDEKKEDLSVGVIFADADIFTRYEAALKEEMPKNIDGLWREAEQSDRYIDISLNSMFNFITIYRNNRLYTRGDVVPDEDCYHVGESLRLGRIGAETYMVRNAVKPMSVKYIDLIVRDDPDVMWVVLEPSLIDLARDDLEVQYVRERERKSSELPICR